MTEPATTSLRSAPVDPDARKPDERVVSATRTLDVETQGLTALRQALDGGLAEPYVQAIELLHRTSGRVIVSGIGKSGHVGQKIAATLSSTGTPAYFIHPTEASHGDLGMIRGDDVIIALSWSGETTELRGLLSYSRRFSVPLIAITSRVESALAKAADVVLELPRVTEACPHGLAPTTSTLMQLALGDCLAVSLLEHRGFTEQDFKVFHPGGQLGASLTHIADIMHTGEAVPLAGVDMAMGDALVIMTAKSFGCLGAVDRDGKLVGIITDGDLRRKMSSNLLAARVSEVMTINPTTATPDLMAPAALARLSGKMTALFVVDGGKPVGIIHIHDLLRIGVA